MGKLQKVKKQILFYSFSTFSCSIIHKVIQNYGSRYAEHDP